MIEQVGRFLGATSVISSHRRKRQFEGQIFLMFGILYGMGVNALRENLGGTREEAQLFYNTYFETFTRLAAYLASDEWRGKAGGYAIQGRAEALIKTISGSYSGIMGLPLFETRALLRAAGYPLG